MPRFNPSVELASKTTNLAGGEAFVEDPRLEFVSILLTSFVKDQFYRPVGDAKDPDPGTVLGRVAVLLNIIPPTFAAKAAIYARTRFGMRTITHIIAGEILRRVKGQKWTAPFISRVIHRPDDMLEIVAYYTGKYGKHPLPNALKRGVAGAFGGFDAYQLAKYRGEGKNVSLVDVVNLVHPKPTNKNRDALAALVKGDLKSDNTWETKLTRAGQKAETDEQKAELKGAAWKELIETRKIGYFALLRNLRNILEQSDEQTVGQALELLVDEKLIRKSLVLPFRYVTAVDALEKVPGSQNAIQAINKAIDVSCANVPALPGRTLVALDISSSMTGRTRDIAALFAAVLLKANGPGADLIRFESRAEYMTVNTQDSVMSIADRIRGSGGGTNLNAVFTLMTKYKRSYDRVIILSDMQSWVGYFTPTRELAEYRKTVGVRPHVFSWDLAGYGTLQFPEREVYALAGFSEKALDIIRLLEEDRDALVAEIEKVELVGC